MATRPCVNNREDAAALERLLACRHIGSMFEPMAEREPGPQKNEFLRIAGVSTALALGFMAGSMQAFTRDAQGFQFRISVFTALTFIAGAAVGWWYWRLVMKMI